MRDYVIITDSCCDLSADLAQELELEVVPLSLQMGGKTYRNWLDGRELSFPDFYRRIRAGEAATTSAVSVGDFEEVMRPILTGGRDILCLCFSSALSTTYQSACIAAQTLSEEVPEGTVRVVDTLCASLGQGLLAYLCAQEKRRGASLEELTAYAETTRGKVCHWFTVDDLDFLKRGGRISPTIAWIGGKLKIKPVLRIAEDGTLAIPEKVRGSKAAMNTIVSKYVSSGLNEEHPYVFLCHGDALEQAEKAKAAILEAVPGAQVTIMPMSPIIGIHTGPGVQAVIYFGNNR